MKIYAYNTHYEITEYLIGMSRTLENNLTLHDYDGYQHTPKYHYDRNNHVLYVPRGYDEDLLSKQLGDRPIEYIKDYTKPRKVSFSMTKPPRNDVQKESIRFLTGKEEYDYMYYATQAVLSLPGGGGKTYSTIAAISIYGVKSMIITHATDIRDQWILRFQEYTNVSESLLVTITGTEQLKRISDGNITPTEAHAVSYLVNHRSIKLFIDEYGIDAFDKVMTKLGIGIKVIDEAHKEFSSTLMMDYATNVWKTFYLTATFKRSIQDDKLFQTSFNRVYKLYKNTEQMQQTRNVYYIIDEFSSDITPVEFAGMFNRKRFSVHKYIDREIDHGYILDHVVKWLKWFYEDRQEDGKTYIISPKKDSCETMCKLVKHFFPNLKACVHNSDTRVENLSDYDVICATFKMVGTGNDLDDLRMIINVEPIGSDANNDQLVHRLMRGKDNRNAYFIEPTDRRIDNVYKMMLRKRKVLKKFVKHIMYLKDSD